MWELSGCPLFTDHSSSGRQACCICVLHVPNRQVTQAGAIRTPQATCQLVNAFILLKVTRAPFTSNINSDTLETLQNVFDDRNWTQANFAVLRGRSSDGFLNSSKRTPKESGAPLILSTGNLPKPGPKGPGTRELPFA